MSSRNGFTYEISKLVVGYVYDDTWSDNPIQYLGVAVMPDGDEGAVFRNKDGALFIFTKKEYRIGWRPSFLYGPEQFDRLVFEFEAIRAEYDHDSLPVAKAVGSFF